MASDDKQMSLKLAFGVHRAVKDAPAKVVRQIETDGQAIAVCMKAAKLKLAYVAALIGKSEGYVSRMRSDQREVPETLVDALCAALGSRLLRQVRDLREVTEREDGRELARLAAMLREAA